MKSFVGAFVLARCWLRRTQFSAFGATDGRHCWLTCLLTLTILMVVCLASNSYVWIDLQDPGRGSDRRSSSPVARRTRTVLHFSAPLDWLSQRLWQWRWCMGVIMRHIRVSRNHSQMNDCDWPGSWPHRSHATPLIDVSHHPRTHACTPTHTQTAQGDATTFNKEHLKNGRSAVQPSQPPNRWRHTVRSEEAFESSRFIFQARRESPDVTRSRAVCHLPTAPQINIRRQIFSARLPRWPQPTIKHSHLESFSNSSSWALYGARCLLQPL